ncbi:MAG: 2-hydroxyacyl-CoA dehydratase [Candidatus Omnitrophota bacterium]|nr:MAG: 2-hydroxyacyl-CoA dehydratase [Candidatus Omnitrophota bacterium]
MARLFQAAYQPDAFVAWRSPFVPTELFYAMDIVPFFPEGACSMLANSRLVAQALDVAKKNYYSGDACSFLRCVAGASIEDLFPAPDILVCTSICCDGAPKMFYNMSKRYKADYFLLDIPYNYNNSEAVDYLARQIEAMIKAIEKKMGKKLDPERLRKAFSFSNEARSYFLRINELRRHVPAPLLGKEAIDCAAAVASTWGTEKIVDIYKLLYDELKERMERSNASLPEARYRILWRHLRPYYSDAIIDYLENRHKAIIAFEEINYIPWDELDADEPYRSLARKILANPGIGCLRHWLDSTMGFVEDYKIDGVIEFAHWGCRHSDSMFQILKTALKARQIPLLKLDGDCIDNRDYSEGRMKIQIDAFLELLGGKK